MSLSKRLQDVVGRRGESPMAGWKSAREWARFTLPDLPPADDQVDAGEARPAADGWYRIGPMFYRVGSGPLPTFGVPVKQLEPAIPPARRPIKEYTKRGVWLGQLLLFD